ncbi:hypothetical protein EUTSA_v10026061mg [Eutrema salsugineum]|uniref:SPT2 chromatin protein n=1 Tax=Eutrema salsugineum TaxID=72664 RepID=V4MDJ7_EUTSA|nr:hypothetical protein EUTSA_v10026061mg [Eutrema salsugineum]
MLNSIQTKKGSGPATKNANEKKRKAEIIKDSRDYSFLLSDDAELPVSLKEPPPRNDPVPNSRPSFWKNQMDHPRPDASRSQMRSRPVPATKPKDHRINLNQRPLSSSKPKPKPKTLTSDPKQQRVEQRKASQELTSSRMVPRQPLPPRVISKPPLKKPQQLKTKKKKQKKMSEEDESALRMIRKMCKTDRYAGRDLEDYDDRGMEANFEDIIKEEKRSEKLAKKEDAEQLRLIEEENTRERVRKEKKQKLTH